MKNGHESKAVFDDLVIYHQNFPKKQVSPHSHAETHVFMPIKGDIWITLDEESIRVSPGKMYILAPNTRHSFASDERQGERLIAMMNAKVKNSVLSPANSLVRELMFHILLDKDAPTVKKSYALLKDMLVELSEQESSVDIDILRSKSKDERIVKSIALMEQDLSISIEAIAKEVGVSSKTLTRLYMLELATNPKRMQNLLRIERAQKLFKTTGMNVTEVAFEVGYNSLSAFIKSYRAITGELPSQAKV